MKIMDFVREELVIADLRGRDKPAVLAELAKHLASCVGGLDANKLLQVLSERERLASTAIGEGVAIPHGKSDSVKDLVACVARSKAGIDFESVDGRPTHLFFVLVAPQNSTGLHLKALARVSRLFKDPAFRARLMEAQGAAEMLRVIADEDAKY